MEQVQSNLSEIYDETPVNYQVSADNGYSTDMNTEYLEQNGFDGYISSRKLSREQKKYNLSDKPFAKDNFFYDNEMMTYICPLYIKSANILIKTSQELVIGPKNAKHTQCNCFAQKEIAAE